MLKKSQNIEEINNSIKKYGLDTDIIISKIISANNLIGTLPSLFNYYDNKTIYATDSRDNEIFAIVEYNCQEKRGHALFFSIFLQSHHSRGYFLNSLSLSCSSSAAASSDDWRYQQTCENTALIPSV